MMMIENLETYGWEAAIRGMRNPMNSWAKSDSLFNDGFDSEYGGIQAHDLNDDHPWIDMDSEDYFTEDVHLGANDMTLMRKLAEGGPVHAKYRRFITVTMDITAPLYWWKEFDTYKVGTAANSCITMHKIHAKEFTLEDFSCEHLISPRDDDTYELFPELEAYDDDPEYYGPGAGASCYPMEVLASLIDCLNMCRRRFLETKDKRYWWQMIQLLPSSYNQRRTVLLNYEVLHNIYVSRKDHKLDEWREFCEMMRKQLSYSELFTMEENSK